jgi:3-deoxy-manno-octulosonate cytidylyltransferase (CMP-KDO synthetase)
MNIICVIPARYASQRLPGKSLAIINGSSMIEWIYKRALAAGIFSEVIVATDDTRIKKTVEGFNGKAVMTPSELPTGTDRVAFVAKSKNADIFVNLQGDEPLIAPQVLVDICEPFENREVLMTTPIKKIQSYKELTDSNLVKVVIDENYDALYFSRTTIPYIRDVQEQKEWIKHCNYYKHIGIYTYRREFLLKLKTLQRGRLENAEKLEQLRVLENGYKIRTILTDYESISVDTPEDLDNVNKYVREKYLKVDVVNERM